MWKGVKLKRRDGFHNIFMAFASSFRPHNLSSYLEQSFSFTLEGFSTFPSDFHQIYKKCCASAAAEQVVFVWHQNTLETLEKMFMAFYWTPSEEDGSIKNECLWWWRRWGALEWHYCFVVYHVRLAWRRLACHTFDVSLTSFRKWTAQSGCLIKC